ncbi:DUF3592 domain-containing protein [Streptomyces lunalinharesii]|uniref:DUF3592 domain-containing protein n=1 Tax=Streptomyces lunalinharesii TaxID=333384 RepID=A0ABN3RK39_9ACTN
MWIALALLAGLTVVGFGAREAMAQRRLQREGITARGLVVRHHESNSGNEGGPSYFAVVEFVDAQGTRHEFQSKSSGVKGLPVGGRVPVRYLSDAPKAARIDLATRRLWDVAFPLAAGSLFTGIGIWMLATGR